MADNKTDGRKLYTKPEVRELGASEEQSVALLILVTKAAARSMNNALQVASIEVDLVMQHLGHPHREDMESLERLEAAIRKAVRLSRIVFGANEPILEVHPSRAQAVEQSDHPAD